MNRLLAVLTAIYGSLAVAAAADATHSTNLWKPLSLVESMGATDIDCPAGTVVVDLADVTAPKAGAKYEVKVVKVNEAGTFGAVTIQNQGVLVMLVTADAEAKKLITGDQVEFRKCGKAPAKTTPPTPAPTRGR